MLLSWESIERNYIENILLKLARGYAAFRLSQLCQEKPNSIWWNTFNSMATEQIESFNSCYVIEQLGEIGPRGIQRLFVTQITLKSDVGDTLIHTLLINDWVDVQDQNYRYIAIRGQNMICIKIVIREFLACEIIWPEKYLLLISLFNLPFDIFFDYLL